MKAALLESIGHLALTQVACPTVTAPNQVLIKVKAVGICGSELHAFNGTHPFRKPPAVLGHEVTGEVVRVGDQVLGFVPGDRVFVDPQWTCGECSWCLSGRHNLCPSKLVLGTQAWSGGLGEYIVAPTRSVYPLPDHISYVDGTLIEPLSVGVHMVGHAELHTGEAVAVLGAGPIGLMVSAVAGIVGAWPIVAVDLRQHCLDLAERCFGATSVLLADGEPIAHKVLDLTHGKRLDLVFMTAGVSTLVAEAMVMAEREGRIMLVALFDEPVELEANDMVQKDLKLLGSQMYDVHDIQQAIHLVASGEVPVSAMVTHVLSLEEVQRGFELAATKDEDAVKVVIQFSE